MVIVALKDATRDFCLLSPRCATNCLQQYTQAAKVQSCANHVQHIQRLSRATCRVQITWNTSSAYRVQHVCKWRATHPALIACNVSCANHVRHIQRLSRATCVQIMRNTSSAYRVQHVVFANHVRHIQRLSRATCRVPHGTKLQLSYNVWQSLYHIYFKLYFTGSNH